MKSYYRLMLGAKSVFADECFKGNFIGVNFLGHIDFTNNLPENWRDFNKVYIPEYLKVFPDKKKVTAGVLLIFGLVFSMVLINYGLSNKQIEDVVYVRENTQLDGVANNVKDTSADLSMKLKSSQMDKVEGIDLEVKSGFFSPVQKIKLNESELKSLKKEKLVTKKLSSLNPKTDYTVNLNIKSKQKDFKYNTNKILFTTLNSEEKDSDVAVKPNEPSTPGKPTLPIEPVPNPSVYIPWRTIF